MLSLSCSPEAQLFLTGQPDADDEPGLAAGFPSLPGEALLLLARRAATHPPPDPGLAWLQRFSHSWLSRVCRTRQENPPMPPDVPAAWVLETPPFPGSEYISPELLASLWLAAGTALESTCALLTGGLEQWLASGHSPWHLVGRVTFHLAENKRDPDKPFAFLATYTGSLNSSGKPSHLPLGRALQSFAAASDQPALDSILTPVRAASQALPWVQDLLESRRVFQALAWSPQEAYRFIRDLPALEASGLILKVPDWWKGGRPSRPSVEVRIDTDPSSLGIGAMLQFHISTTLDGTPLSASDWERIKASPNGLINLRGQWVEIDQTRLRQVMAHWDKVAAAHAHGGLPFHEGMRFLAGFQPGGPGAASPESADSLSGWTRVMAGKNLAAILGELRHPDKIPQVPELRATLRPYQEKGLAWLSFMRRLGLGACLADDMGLGKTLQVIALLTMDHSAAREKHKAPTGPVDGTPAEWRDETPAGSTPSRPQPLITNTPHNPAKASALRPDPFPILPSPSSSLPALLVVPASLLGNWLSEFRNFAPQLRVFTAHPSRTPREILDKALRDPDTLFPGYHAVLTTYGLLQRSSALLSYRWQAVILDEAQAIKNAGTAQAKAVKKTIAPWRLALTGTPVENRPGDLWSLFDFLNPGLLGSAAAFSATLKRLADSRGSGSGYAPLRRLIQPYILRRMKTDRSIIPDLPDKTEVTAACSLSRKQAILYGKLVEQLKDDLKNPGLDPMTRRGLVVGYLLKFKQVCNHSSHWSGDGVYDPADSGKFQRLAELCQEIAGRQERVLIFTQFREIIDPLHAFLTHLFKRPGLILHGGTPVRERQNRVDQFQAPGGPPFFLLSVKAGGTGLTLTAASHVIHFDRWWNPAVENQATDRAFRIGQKRHVLVHKFVTTGTLEERIDALIEDKKSSARELLGQDGGPELLLTEMSDEALLEFVSLDTTAALGE